MRTLKANQVLTEKGKVKAEVRKNFNKELTTRILKDLKDLDIAVCERGFAIPLVKDEETGEVIINAVIEMVITESDINKKYVRKSKTSKKEVEEVVSLFPKEEE